VIVRCTEVRSGRLFASRPDLVFRSRLSLALAPRLVLGCPHPCSEIIPNSIHSKLLPLFEAAMNELGYAKGVPAKRTLGKRSPSLKKRLCKVHGRPIQPGRWRSGHRTTGCADCYRTKEMPPPKKRLCKEHNLPIIRQRWWSGYRNKGCTRCFKVPPPKKRLCRKHHQPIQPSSWLRGRHSTGCSSCHNSRPGYRRAKARYRQRLRQEAKIGKKKRR
jgi:hypothetical protein